jgi:activator of HSP90 ATPase
MNKTIEKTIDFKGTTARELFEIYTSSKKHTEIHGGRKAIITDTEGEQFSLLNGNLEGRNLLVVPYRMIVQSWRGNVWRKNDLDSILTLVFSDISRGARIHMTHACTPDQFEEMWDEVYWEPIKAYLFSK